MADKSAAPGVWQRIEAQLPVAERDEVRRIIGADLVERNGDLRQEADALREILEEFQQQNEAFREQLRRRVPLPEHPARVLLEQQIALLIQSVRQSNSQVAQAVLSPTSKKELQVRDYVLRKQQERLDGGKSPRVARPGTSHGRAVLSGRPSRPGTASSARSSESAPADILEPLGEGRLAVFHMDRITKDIRAALAEEAEQLLEEIEYLQSLLDMEHDEISEEKREALAPPPPLREMRDYTAKLERTWLLEDLQAGVQTPPVFLKEARLASAQASAKPATPKAPEKLRRAVQQARASH